MSRTSSSSTLSRVKTGAALLIAAVALMPSAAMAQQDGDTSTTLPSRTLTVPTLPVVTLPPSSSASASMAAMQQQYLSASEAMAQIYAKQGSPMTSLGAPSASGQVTTFSTLMQGATGVDQAVIAAGTKWADQLAAFRAKNALGTPEMNAEWKTASSSLAAMTARATASLAAIAPQAFTSLRSGAGAPSDAALWSQALKAAGMEASTSSATAGSSCIAAMMAASSSGDAQAAAKAGSGCGRGLSACISSGLYFFNKLRGVASGGVTDPGVLPPADINKLQPWQRDAIAEAAPSITGSTATPSVGTCGAGKAVAATTNQVLPKAWGALGGSSSARPATGSLPSGWAGLGGK